MCTHKLRFTENNDFSPFPHLYPATFHSVFGTTQLSLGWRDNKDTELCRQHYSDSRTDSPCLSHRRSIARLFKIQINIKWEALLCNVRLVVCVLSRYDTRPFKPRHNAIRICVCVYLVLNGTRGIFDDFTFAHSTKHILTKVVQSIQKFHCATSAKCATTTTTNAMRFPLA